jgi:glycosyltransferase involved in cell wall biosynthesis
MGELNPVQSGQAAGGASRPQVVINGKFLGANFTAVHRVAGELVSGMDRLRQQGRHRDLDAEVIRIAGFPEPPPFSTFPVRAIGPLKGQPWEQLELPLAVRGRLLVNLCNLAPVAVSNAITLIHDAQVFSAPDSYSWAFATWYRAVYRLNGRRHTIVTISEFSRNELIRFGVAEPENIHVISNGVDHMLRHPADTSVIDRLGLDSQPFVLAIANAQPHKNVRVLLKAFQRPDLAGVRLVLFGGTGPEAFAEEGNAFPSNVIFAGKVTDGELRGLMEAALCTAFPSRTEGFGMPPLEGMLLGAPAIISPCGALPEVCGPSALVADPDQPESWAARILELAGNPDLRARLSAAGIAHASAFTWDRAAGSLLDLVASTATGEGPASHRQDEALTGAA